MYTHATLHAHYLAACVSAAYSMSAEYHKLHMHAHYLAACVSAVYHKPHMCTHTTWQYVCQQTKQPIVIQHQTSVSFSLCAQLCTDQVKGTRVSAVHAGHAGSVGRHQLVILFVRYLHRCTPPCPARQTTSQIAWLN